jgi:hypothetical protein
MRTKGYGTMIRTHGEMVRKMTREEVIAAERETMEVGGICFDCLLV